MKLVKKTLPYWKNWKKTERLQHSPERAELLIILQRETNFLNKTLPYWKNWKKTERLQQEPEELEKQKKLLIKLPEEVKSLERYELEKRTKLLI